jgi:hypothetical protein
MKAVTLGLPSVGKSRSSPALQNLLGVHWWPNRADGLGEDRNALVFPLDAPISINRSSGKACRQSPGDDAPSLYLGSIGEFVSARRGL